MKTIAQQLNVTEFPFEIKDKNGNTIYYEYPIFGFWWKREYDSEGNQIYFENSFGRIHDKRPKPCENKVVEIEGIKYKLTAV